MGKVIRLDDYRNDDPVELMSRMSKLNETIVIMNVDPKCFSIPRHLELTDLKEHLMTRWLELLRKQHGQV